MDPLVTSALIGAGSGAASGVAGMFGRKKQHNRNKELMGLQQTNNKELMNLQKDLDKKMWEETNYPAQVKMLEEAGLNVGLMYGMGGTGGATVGGSGGGAGLAAAPQGNVGEDAITGLMAAAQLKAMDAQTKKTEAETKSVEANTEGTEFQNELNNTITVQKMADNYAWAADKVEIESARANAEWEAYLEAGFEGKSFRDPSSPVAKALKAGFEKSVTELEKAKVEKDVKEAEAIIKRFEADMAKQGIHTSSPWYFKFGLDLLNKAGIKID